MLYHSTRSDKAAVDSAQAVLEGLASDGGLFSTYQSLMMLQKNLPDSHLPNAA